MRKIFVEHPSFERGGMKLNWGNENKEGMVNRNFPMKFIDFPLIPSP